MKGPTLEAARAFREACQRRGIRVTPNRDDWRLRLWEPTRHPAWVQAHHHLKADILPLLTGSPDLSTAAA
ncbi:MAG TPA: hypothetical protein VE690_22870 [Rhodopila sp.]|nr:hypothetical protein [Rhodopila sp.]